MNTLAIDGSTKATGIAVFENKELKYYTCIYEKGNDTIGRILRMANAIKTVCGTYEIHQIVMEDVIPEDVKHNDNVYTALKYLQAAVVFVVYGLNIPIEFKTASWWRSRCGIRTGPGIKRDKLKEQSIEFVKIKYNKEVTDDIADAVCLGCAYLGIGSKTELQPFNWE